MESVPILSERYLDRRRSRKRKEMIELKRIREERKRRIQSLPEYDRLIKMERQERAKDVERAKLEIFILVMQIFTSAVICWNSYNKVMTDHPMRHVYPFGVTLFSAVYELIACIALWENSIAGLVLLWPGVGAMLFTLGFAVNELGESLIDLQGSVAIAEFAIVVLTLIGVSYGRRFAFRYVVLLNFVGVLLSSFAYYFMF